MLGERFQTERPDPMVDSIGYHEWFEDNKCPCCNGKGERLYNVRGCDPMEHDCRCCQGSGLRDDDYQCTGFDHCDFE